MRVRVGMVGSQGFMGYLRHTHILIRVQEPKTSITTERGKLGVQGKIRTRTLMDLSLSRLFYPDFGYSEQGWLRVPGFRLRVPGFRLRVPTIPEFYGRTVFLVSGFDQN